MKKLLLLIIGLIFITSIAYAQSNGKLQIHFIDAGQADAAILISPKGEVVMFDNGASGHCTLPVSYLEQLGVTKIDYHVASHYHDDHIGCTVDVLGRFPLQKTAFDRGALYSSQSFNKYKSAIGDKRKTATVGERIILDPTDANPVYIEFIALNGAGVNTTNENDLSVVAVIRFRKFDLVMGGDLSGFDDSIYKDIESLIANSIGRVEVYKVHHHGSTYSSNDYWLSVINPKIGIISVGNGNIYNHPDSTCLDRLHNAGVKTYWTEYGEGVTPKPGWDEVAGNIVVEVSGNSNGFSVAYNNGSMVDTYQVWEANLPSCTYKLNPTSASYTASGGKGSVNIATGSDCPWTATSNAPSWILVTSASSGKGNGTVDYNVSANTEGVQSGTITIADQTFLVNIETSVKTPAGNNGGGGCFIATAAYGSYLDPHVMVLRKFRDDYLITNPIGQAFVDIYYKVSPPISEVIVEHKSLIIVTRLVLLPVIFGIENPIVFLLFILSIIGFIVIRLKLKKMML